MSTAHDAGIGARDAGIASSRSRRSHDKEFMTTLAKGLAVLGAFGRSARP